MDAKEVKRLSKLFAKDAEGMFESEKWDIEETKLYFEANIKVSLEK
jgi:hypothetical protein